MNILKFKNIWKTFSPVDSYSGRKKGLELRRNWLGYLIMLPALLSIALWVYYPMISGSQLFFQDYRVVGSSSWIGLDNLAGVLFSDEWWGSVWNTFRYMFLMLSIGFAAPIILAVLLQEVSHGKIIYRTIYYLPAVMSGLVVMFMWKLFYQSGSTGILNQVGVNVANMSLHRRRRGGDALMVIETDQHLLIHQVDFLRQLDGILSVTYYDKEDEDDGSQFDA